MDGFKERLRNKINTKRNEIMYIDYGITFDGVCDPVATEMIAVVTAMTRFFFFFSIFFATAATAARRLCAVMISESNSTIISLTFSQNNA